MAGKFTRIEFEEDIVLVVKNNNHDDGFMIKGNKASGLNRVINLNNHYHLSHVEMVDNVIESTGRRVKRRLSHIIRL